MEVLEATNENKAPCVVFGVLCFKRHSVNMHMLHSLNYACLFLPVKAEVSMVHSTTASQLAYRASLCRCRIGYLDSWSAGVQQSYQRRCGEATWRRRSPY